MDCKLVLRSSLVGLMLSILVWFSAYAQKTKPFHLNIERSIDFLDRVNVSDSASLHRISGLVVGAILSGELVAYDLGLMARINGKYVKDMMSEIDTSDTINNLYFRATDLNTIKVSESVSILGNGVTQRKLVAVSWFLPGIRTVRGIDVHIATVRLADLETLLIKNKINPVFVKSAIVPKGFSFFESLQLGLHISETRILRK